jgi:hypothetical protein
MSTATNFPLQELKRSLARLSRAPHRDGGKKILMFWRRSEPTTFQKCLAIHMYYAEKPEPRGLDPN